MDEYIKHNMPLKLDYNDEDKKPYEDDYNELCYDDGNDYNKLSFEDEEDEEPFPEPDGD